MTEENMHLLHSDIVGALTALEYDVTKRNEYMRTRYDAIYVDGLYRDLDIDGWFAQYNMVARVVDIMTTQLFGRGFDPVSTYSKEDLSVFDESQPDQKQQMDDMKLKNKKLKADADLRHRVALAIIKDNGGMGRYEDGGRIGSALGTTVWKQYKDVKNKKVVQTLIESPENVRVGWRDDDFREWDHISYVYQMSVDSATRKYIKRLPDGCVFATSTYGSPLVDNFGSGNTADPLNQNASDGRVPETQRPMVAVIDFCGFLPEWGVVNGKLQKVKRGDETEFSVLDIGGYPVSAIIKEKDLPKYYVVNNRQNPRQAWGASDVSDTLLDINKEIVRLMADEMSWADQNLWKIILGIDMTEESLAKLKNKRRRTKVVAVSPGQDLKEMSSSNQPLSEFERLASQKVDMFIRLSGVGRVMFDDPSVNANSNQALMTTLKGVVDIVESKQKRWAPVLETMMTDALYMAADFIPGLSEALSDDPSWFFTIEWPSILRREDASYQTMWLNFLQRGVVSVETFMQKTLPITDTGEEMDRIIDEMQNPFFSAILGAQVGSLAQMAINKYKGIPPWGYVIPKVQLKGDLAPQEVGNIAHNFNWDQGPYGDAIGPTGYQGAQADDAYMNSDFLQKPADGIVDGPQANFHGAQPTQNANPQLTADQNTGQTASQPGSGAPAVSPAGAVNAHNQQHGR